MFSSRVDDDNVLASILGFQVRYLPIKHLGTPMIGCLVAHKDYDFLLADIPSILTRWSNKALSYKGRMQLMEWIFLGKFKYLM